PVVAGARFLADAEKLVPALGRANERPHPPRSGRRGRMTSGRCWMEKLALFAGQENDRAQAWRSWACFADLPSNRTRPRSCWRIRAWHRHRFGIVRVNGPVEQRPRATVPGSRARGRVRATLLTATVLCQLHSCIAMEGSSKRARSNG